MTTKATIQQIRDDLFLIQLPIPLPGFDGFISTWVHTAEPVVVIDVGPSVTAPALLDALAALEVHRPDLVFLTHIHIDHAGGIGQVASAFPDTPVVCHPKAVPHLIDPERLWHGSLDTLGETARAFGPIAPMPSSQILPSDQLKSSSMVCLNTPGHAAHHISFSIGDLLFAGEAGGVCLPFDDQTLYLRPATPPRFFLETHLESIDRLLALKPDHICYSHVGLRTNAKRLIGAHRDQLLHWRDWIHPFFETAGPEASRAMRACRDHLLSNDPLLAGFSQLPANVQQRERNFMLNSIKGYWEYMRLANK